MDERLRGFLFILLIILTIIFFVWAIGSGLSAKTQRTLLDRERAKAFDLEEKLEKLQKEKLSLEEKLKLSEADLEKLKTKHQETQKLLTVEQETTKALKDELTKVTRLKELLEKDLKEALTSKEGRR